MSVRLAATPRLPARVRTDAVLRAVRKQPALGPAEITARVERVLGRSLPKRIDASLRAVLGEAVRGPNAKDACAVAERAQRVGLSGRITAALTLGVARPRTAAPEGQRGVIRRSQAEVITSVVEKMPSKGRRKLERLLAAADRRLGPQCDPDAERALILKSFVTRRKPSDADWQVIEGFARRIRGMPRYALMRTTTLMDIDSTRSTSRLDTTALDNKKPRGRLKGNHKGKNDDGLVQAYDSSCGPAAASLLLGEADPIFSFDVHATGGPHALWGKTPADAIQRQGVLQFGDKPRRRRGAYIYRRIKTAAEELVRKKKITSRQRLALLRYCRTPTGALTPDAERALAVLRRTSKFPSSTELARVRESAPATKTMGSDTAQMRRLLARTIESRLGKRFKSYTGRGPAFVNRHARRIARAARAQGVIMGTSDHWWAIAGARVETDGSRSFLIHDSWTGQTAWVSQPALADGTFQRTVFGWSKRTVVDTLIIPR